MVLDKFLLLLLDNAKESSFLFAGVDKLEEFEKGQLVDRIDKPLILWFQL